MADGILNSFQAPNFAYIRRKTVERRSSLAQAQGLLSKSMPMDVNVQNRKAQIVETLNGDIS